VGKKNSNPEVKKQSKLDVSNKQTACIHEEMLPRIATASGPETFTETLSVG
jgi:hypothetical protein